MLQYQSPDGQEDYPGTLVVEATYTLTEENELHLQLHAATDQPTVVNLTYHPYFNLRSEGDVLGHVLQIAADHFTPLDETQIPTGEIRPLKNTPFDSLRATALGLRIDLDDARSRQRRGYDHNWITGVKARVFLDGPIVGKGGARYGPRSGFCREPQ